MCLKKEYLETLNMEEGVVVHLSDNEACKVNGVGTLRLKMFNNHKFLLYNVRYVL